MECEDHQSSHDIVGNESDLGLDNILQLIFKVLLDCDINEDTSEIDEKDGVGNVNGNVITITPEEEHNKLHDKLP